jgi:predicted esterase
MGDPEVDPHGNASVIVEGTPLEEAKVGVIMLHGRGSSAEDILTLTSQFGGDGVAYLAPEAEENSWYPHWFMSKLQDNQPDLDSALSLLDNLMKELVSVGIPPQKTLIMGFLQGACLASEFAVRNSQRFGGIVALSGGLM